MGPPNNAIPFPNGATPSSPSSQTAHPQNPHAAATAAAGGKLRRRTFTIGADNGDEGEVTNNGETVLATKKRLRGRSLRSNVLLRPRRLSIPAPPSTAAPPIAAEPPPPKTAEGITANGTVMVPGERDEAEDEDEDDDDYDSDSDYDYSSNEEEEDDDEVVAAAAGVGVAGVGVEVYRARSGSIAIIAAGRSRQEEYTSAQDTVFWGWVVLLSTWVVFVVGIGSVMGVWEWAWGGEPKTWPRSVGGEKDYPGEFPIPGYYPAMCILTCIMAWVWVVVAWVGMKYFKHAKIQT